MSNVSATIGNTSPGAVVRIPNANTLSGDTTFNVAAVAAHAVNLLDAMLDSGVPLTATAGSSGMGISRTAGTSTVLVGEATSGSAKANRAVFSMRLPDTYVSGTTTFTVTTNAYTTGGGTLNTGLTNIGLAAYALLDGVETALSVSPATVAINATNTATQTFTVTTTTQSPGSQILLELTMTVTSSSGANTGNLAQVTYTA